VTPFDLADTVAVVTGACGRLGPVWADGLLQAGATVVGLDLDEAPESERFARLANHAPEGRLRIIRADVCDRWSLDRVLEVCRQEVGVPTVLVNNAGVDQPPARTSSTTLDDIPAASFQRVIDVNVVGAFQAMQVFGHAMAREGGGAIVNIGSLYGSVSPDARMYDHLDMDPPFLKPPAYGASKAALHNLTRYFATHWASVGVRVNTLSPGGVWGGQDPTFVEKFSARVPLGRLACDADLAGPLVFLASPAAAYVTGIELRVDGGYTAW
jgi:NAD(P)-dependent dehydrogenase (short-subunit alcohol dehydrogenase family)